MSFNPLFGKNKRAVQEMSKHSDLLQFKKNFCYTPKGISQENLTSIHKPKMPSPLTLFLSFFLNLRHSSFSWMNIYHHLMFKKPATPPPPGGLRRKKQRGAKRISIIPIIVMSHGNPIAFTTAPPAEGPFRKQRIR